MNPITTATRMWLTRSTKPFLFTNENDNELFYTNTNNLGLYIHIPFCRKLCSFCPYCKVKYDAQLCEDYIDALIKEINYVGKQGSQKKVVTSLYFGGGSPALAADRLIEIIHAIQAHFEIKQGIGIELHPQEVTVDCLRKLKESGITKISIGIQSFQDDFLEILGREKINYNNMLDALKEVTFDTVSMDFIFALPGQTFELLKRDIDTAFEKGANHIAIYPFIDFTFANHNVKKINNSKKRKMLDDITIYCEKQGYTRDSIWTYSSEKGKKYSSMTRDNFLGFGCSATTLLEDRFKINTFSAKEYIRLMNTGKLATSLTVRFTRRQRMIYYLFWTAYTTRISARDFEEFFGVPLKSKYRFELWIAKCFGYITENNGTYVMTRKGAYYYHYYENFYTLSYIDKMWGILRKEAFPQKLKL